MWRPSSWLTVASAVLAVGTGCGRFGYEPRVQPVDAAERTTGDAEAPDALAFGDAPTPMGRICTPSFQSAIALWDFEDLSTPTIADSVGPHDGTARGRYQQVPGPLGPCGEAILFTADLPHVFVGDHADWQLALGSIDLWVKPDASPGMRALLSRDSRGGGAGHFLLVLADGHLILRIQAEATNAVVLCSTAPLPSDRWSHIGINLGEPAVELLVDGVAVTGDRSVQELASSLGMGRCGTTAATGIAGNREPWFIGASAHLNVDQTPELPAIGVAIDHVRISRARRDFAAMWTTGP